jgi:cytochrome bd-type quinol oxidase subunit 1
VGDWIARRAAEDQPLKLAGFEGLGETTEGAPVHIGGWYADGEVRWGIEIPRLLSLLARHDEDVPLAVELRDGDPVSELSQAGVAATSGAAVGGVVGRVSAARLAATSRSTATASLARSG